MCGRTVLTASPADLREVFGLDAAPELVPRYNVTPSQDVAAVRMVSGPEGGRRTMAMLRWGLVPAWADSAKVGQKLALARSETVATTPAFRDAFRARRCLVVVNGFYEWRRDGKSSSQPFLLRRPDGAVFALAGVWDRWTSRDGEVLESCAILTHRALTPVSTIHDRMPIVMPPADWDAWLDPESANAAHLLDPREPPVVATAVSTYVNDPRHDDQRCFEPPQAAAQGSLF